LESIIACMMSVTSTIVLQKDNFGLTMDYVELN